MLHEELQKLDPEAYAKKFATGTAGMEPERVHAVGVLIALMAAGYSSLDVDSALAEARQIAEGATPEELADLASEE